MGSTSGAAVSPALVAAVAATAIATIAAPFHTEALAWPMRALFWAVLIFWQMAKWWLWPQLRPAALAAPAWLLAGVVLLNALLPLELIALFTALGRDIAIVWLPTFGAALLIGAAIAGTIAALGPHRRAGALMPPTPAGGDAAPAPVPAPAPLPAAPLPSPPSAVAAGQLAMRAGLADLGCIEAVVAEDHYLRLYLAGGGRPLVLHRFGDALAELTALDGLQVHRGAWVAARAVAGARRDGRRWWLRLADGSELRVSETHLPAVRARGWLRP